MFCKQHNWEGTNTTFSIPCCLFYSIEVSCNTQIYLGLVFKYCVFVRDLSEMLENEDKSFYVGV